MRERRSITIEGVVQGVGFRPFVHGLAATHRLGGFVRNDSSGVRIEVEGRSADVEAFLSDVTRLAPPLARVERVQVAPCDAHGQPDFRILASAASEERTAIVPPDSATCDACLRELFDPADRRYRYPFLNCTHCGPRLTIVRDVPYDRARTTMAGFELCDECRREYEDPADRRFHAQPTACPACGPRLALRDPEGGGIADEDDALLAAAAALSRGLIVAVKGLGGYHLACDASDPQAVGRLRERKNREARPLALMVGSLEAARALCHLEGAEVELLTSPRRPIVLLRKREIPAAGRDFALDAPMVAEGVAPRNRYLGVMLPYTPLHHLLLVEVGRPLVMTSGNMTDEPIAYTDEDASNRLGRIADLFLAHDRPIVTRCDDSVARVLCGGEVIVRRSRGYAPAPIALPWESPAPLLAVGGHLKNTFCFVRGARAFLSHHIGDLDTLAARGAFEEGIEHYGRLLGIQPEVVAHDLHPDYVSTRFAAGLTDVEYVGVQHHHAHVAACMVEHGMTEPVIGVSFDGTGYGTDGAVWGGEFMVATPEAFERVAHLRYVPLPGGEAAIRQPWRLAAVHLQAALGSAMEGSDVAGRIAERAGPGRWSGVLELARKGVNSPPTSSVGRLFDAVAALLGIRHEVSYEAQAAIELEMVADPDVEGCYPAEFSREEGRWLWEPGPIILGILRDLERGRPRAAIASSFHNSVAAAILEASVRIRREHGLSRVALTGGVFQNARLTERAMANLEGAGFEVLLHRRVPSNDGGLSFGQAVVACARLSSSGGALDGPGTVDRVALCA